MSYETAWKEMVGIISNIKGAEMEGDLESIILCVEHLQSELETEEEVTCA